MSSHGQSEGPTGRGEKTYFEQQRELLVGEIAVLYPFFLTSRFLTDEQSLEQVLQNLNKLNRSLEGVIAVGNEFGSVEALWSQFENVMAKNENADTDSQAASESGQADEGK